MVAPHRPSPQRSDESVLAASLLGPRAEPGRKTTCCYLTTLHPERALSLALVQHLSDELPDVAFTLEQELGADVVWVCGYERGNAALIRDLRARHPLATLLVTAKASEELWSAEVLAAGADHALAWPVELRRLSRVLRSRPFQRRA